jgi:hypothetical protein
MTPPQARNWATILAAAALGSLFALSIISTPVKFLAPEVPLTHLLAVGRVRFRASLALECAFLKVCCWRLLEGFACWLWVRQRF